MAWEDARYPRNSRLPGDWQTRRKRVLRRDRGLCQIKGPRCTYRATEVDHIVAGDNHEIEALQAACSPCHRDKTAREAGEASGKANTARAQARLRPKNPHPGLVRPGDNEKPTAEQWASIPKPFGPRWREPDAD